MADGENPNSGRSGASDGPVKITVWLDGDLLAAVEALAAELRAATSMTDVKESRSAVVRMLVADGCNRR